MDKDNVKILLELGNMGRDLAQLRKETDKHEKIFTGSGKIDLKTRVNILWSVLIPLWAGIGGLVAFAIKELFKLLVK